MAKTQEWLNDVLFVFLTETGARSPLVCLICAGPANDKDNGNPS